MIDFGRAPLHLADPRGGVTAFPDHADPRLFHVLADRPRLRVGPDGRPDLTLLRYQLPDELTGVLGGGLLSLGVALPTDEEVLARLRSRLLRHFDLDAPPRLAPVVAERGTCRLVLVDRASGDAGPEPGGGDAGGGDGDAGDGADAPLVERILGGSTPALYGDQPATFLAVLSPPAVTLVEQALRGGGLPVGVLYALEVVGIRPALRGRFVAHWRQVYEFFESRFHGGKLLLTVDIGPIMEELVRRELVQVEIDQLVPEQEKVAEYEGILEQVQQEILRNLFRPTLGEAPLEEGGDDFLELVRRGVMDVIGAFSFTFSLRELDRRELKTSVHELSVARAEARTLAPQGTLARLAGRDGSAEPLDVDAHVRDLPPVAAREMRFDVGSAVDLAAQGVTALEVVLRYGARQETLTLTPEQPRGTFVAFYDEAVGRAIEVAWTAHLAVEDPRDPAQVDAPAAPYESRVIRLDPLSLVERLRVAAVAQGVPFDRYPSVLVDVEASVTGEGSPRGATLELTAAAPEAEWSARLPAGARVALRKRLRYVRVDGRVLERPWDGAEPGRWVVGDPLPDALRVHLVAAARFGDEVDRLVVELAREQEPGDITALELTADAPTAVWSAALEVPADAGEEARAAARAWRYRVLVRTVRGEVREGTWQPGDGGRLVVGDGTRLREVQLLPLGPSLEALGLLALKVRLTFEDPEAGLHAEHEALVEAPGTPVTWRYPVADPERVTWTWQLTLVHADGTLERVPPEPARTAELMAVHVLT